MKKLVYRLFLFYWWVFKPSTYGVKILLKKGDEFLLISNSYDVYSKWNIPGGGYNPRKESETLACIREVREELGINIEEKNLQKLGNYYSEAEHKKDNVNIYLYEVSDNFDASGIKINYEVGKYSFFSREEIKNLKVFKIAKHAIALAS